MKNSNCRRRWAETVVILGLCLMAVTAVSWADGSEPPPPPPPAVTQVPTQSPEPAQFLEPTPAPPAAAPPTATPEATPTANVAPTTTPSSPPAAAAPPATTLKPLRSRAPRLRPQATPAPSPTPVPPSQSDGAALTICHYTDDEADPYVAVTIPANGYSPHFDEELDIIPAPSTGCDGIDDPDAAAREPVTVCHATGDPDRPYVLLRYPNGDLGGHEDDAGDLIPAPGGTCPGPAGPGYAVLTPTATATPADTGEPTATPQGTSQTDPAAGTRGDRRGRGDRGERSAAVTAQPAAAPVVTGSGDDLPFTGLDLGLLLTVGCGFVMTGSGLRLISQPAAQPPVGVTR